MEIGSNFKNSY